MTTRPQTETDVGRFEQALTALTAGDRTHAFTELAEIFKQDPGNAEVNFALGLAAVGISKFSHATLAFERVLALQPDNDRARLELARTYAAMGQFSLAEDFFRQVLENSPPPVVQRNIEKYLAEIDVAKRNWAITVQVGTGMFYDDNVNVGPSDRSISIAPTTFGLTVLDTLVVGDETLPQEDFGWFGLVSLSGTYDPGFRGRWSLLGGTSFYKTWLNDEHAYEINYLRTYAGVRHSGREHLFQTRFNLDYLERDNEAFTTVYGLAPVFIYAPAPTYRLTTQGAVEVRDYDTADALDATFVELGESVTRVNADAGRSATLGLSGFYNDADAGEFDYAGVRVNADADQALPWDLTLRVGVGYRFSDYSKAEVLAKEARDDHGLTANLSVSRPVGENANVSISYSHTTNRSSFDLYDYERNVVNTSVDYSF